VVVPFCVASSARSTITNQLGGDIAEDEVAVIAAVH
jgi:hypothetical protein